MFSMAMKALNAAVFFLNPGLSCCQCAELSREWVWQAGCHQACLHNWTTIPVSGGPEGAAEGGDDGEYASPPLTKSCHRGPNAYNLNACAQLARFDFTFGDVVSAGMAAAPCLYPSFALVMRQISICMDPVMQRKHPCALPLGLPCMALSLGNLGSTAASKLAVAQRSVCCPPILPCRPTTLSHTRT